MGITGLIPFLEQASKKVNVGEFNGSTVAIDTYCWLHKGAFACADKLVRGEETDVYVKYCLKYVTMLQSKNIKPILVFDGRHLPAKALTELKRKESRNISKKRAAELLSLGKMDEARSFMRRSVDVTHLMALSLIKECRKRNVDCIVAPYEADAQLAYLNIKNYAQLVITEDSDLILFGCTKVLFKMDLSGDGSLVDAAKLPLVMKCPVQQYSLDKFRRMCILSGCDYLPSLPGIGLAKARQFVNASRDPDFANALRKLSNFFNRPLEVSDEYRQSFLRAEATFKHQYVFDPAERRMTRLTATDDEDVERALCVNAGEPLEPRTALQLALGNLEPFTLKKLDDWDPDSRSDAADHIRTTSWRAGGAASRPSIWSDHYGRHLRDSRPWSERPAPPAPGLTEERGGGRGARAAAPRAPRAEPPRKKKRIEDDDGAAPRGKSPILENKERSFRKCLRSGSFSVLKKLSRFPRTVLDHDDVIESKFFNSTESRPPARCRGRGPEPPPEADRDPALEVYFAGSQSSQKENSLSPKKGSPVLESHKSRNPFKSKAARGADDTGLCESLIDNTCAVGSQSSPAPSPPTPTPPLDKFKFNQNTRMPPTISNKRPRGSQPTLLTMFGFQKKPVLKR